MSRYITTFPNTETPLSESGNWIAGWPTLSERHNSSAGFAVHVTLSHEEVSLYQTASGARQSAKITLGALDAASLEEDVGVICRGSNLAGNQFLNRAQAIRNAAGHTTEIHDVVNNADTTIYFESATTWAVNDTLELVCDGTTATVKRNGAALGSGTSTQTSGNVGIYSFLAGGSTSVFADFDGGDLPVQGAAAQATYHPGQSPGRNTGRFLQTLQDATAILRPTETVATVGKPDALSHPLRAPGSQFRFVKTEQDRTAILTPTEPTATVGKPDAQPHPGKSPGMRGAFTQTNQDATAILLPTQMIATVGMPMIKPHPGRSPGMRGGFIETKQAGLAGFIAPISGIVFRKTLSGIGSHTGGREAIGD